MRTKHPLIIVLTMAVSVTIGLIAMLQLLRTEVVLVDGAKEEKIITFSKNVKELIEKQSLALRPLDEVYPSEETRLSEGLRIVIKRFKPIIVKVDDKEVAVYQKNLSAKEVLRRAGVMLGANDAINVSLDRIIKSGEVILVNKEEKTIITVDREIPFKNTTVANKDLDPGERRIEQFGVMGAMRDYYEITRFAGKEISRMLIKTETLAVPTPQIMHVGPAYKKPINTASSTQGTAGQPQAASPKKSSSTASNSSLAMGNQLLTTRSKNFAYKNSYVMIATAYDLSYASTGKLPGMPGYGITKSGTKARVGAIAVDPTVIPLGTKLYIEYADGSGAYGYATAEDTGSAIKGYRVDLFFNTYQECIEFGRRRVIVYVLE